MASSLAVTNFVRLVAAASVFCLASPFAFGQSVAAGVASQKVVAAAKMPRPLSFASALAEEQHSAGFVLELDAPRSVDVMKASPGVRGTLVQAVNAFRMSHPGYQVTETLGVLVIEPKKRTACQAALERKIPGVVLQGELHKVLNDAFSLVNPEHPKGPPSVLGQVPTMPYVTVAVPWSTLRDALNDIARQVPGFVWVVQHYTNPVLKREVCSFDYFYKEVRAGTGWQLEIGR
jgi:hypothetical protein